jgi:Icc-related predicted phosphoesterase
MKIIQVLLFLLTSIISYTNTFAKVPQRIGWWKFDIPADLTKAEPGFGLPLDLVGIQTAVNGSVVNNGATLIGVGSYYKMTHLITPSAGNKVNEYSLQYDFKIPANGSWSSFFQTTVNNSGDADFFINPNGNIGVAAVGYSEIAITPNEWYRLIISVKNGSQFNCYLDGKLLLKGAIQPVNGRFSLENQLLVFADEDEEDGPIYCSELAIWDKALTASEVSELGGYTHSGPTLSTRIPYLQSPGQTFMTVSWHDTSEVATKVVFGLDSTNLNMETTGTSEIISEPFRWHTVYLSSLQPNTRYFYKVSSGTQYSHIYSFRTLPDSDFSGKLRFIMLSDTHGSDTTMAGKIARSARSKISEMYGHDIENQITGIIHSGDIVVNGGSPEQYNKQFFMPLSSLTSNIPTLVVAGNHEVESPFFYKYLKLDELSAFSGTPALNEKILQFRVGNSLFLGLNTNIYRQYGAIQANWLDSKLNGAQKDDNIDFIFLFFHHPPISELWDYVNTQDEGSAYVRDYLLPILKRYSKVQQINYGHTHGFERGTIQSEQKDGDFRIICGGGGGGFLDPWAAGENRDFNDITKTISNYIFQILEIDIANQSFQNSVYSLGTLSSPKNGELIDSWYKKTNQIAPQTPIIEKVTTYKDSIRVTSSPFSGIDSLMTVQIQLSGAGSVSEILLDTFVQRINIYGVDRYSNPVDLNQNIDIYNVILPITSFSQESIYLKTRYRDNNLKWSSWSENYLFITTGINDFLGLNKDLPSFQNFPNPFKNTTTFKYEIEESSFVTFKFYDTSNKIIFEKNEGIKSKGTHLFHFHARNMKNGIYICEMISGSQRCVMTVIKTN